jgi:DNA-directed RNA polymerase subunit beta'
MAETFGRYLVNSELPKDYRVTGPANKKDFSRRMSELAKKDPKQYANLVANFKRLGDTLSTQEGMSVGLDDITPDYTTRNRTMSTYLKRFREAKSDEARRRIADDAQSKMLNNVMKHPGSLTQQVRSGARGKPFALMGIVSGPVTASDPTGQTAPWIIEKSYSEGLTPADYWVAGNEAILNTIKSNTSVSEPGELSKVLVNNMNDLIITEDDCGTTNGILLPATNPDVVDRYLARDTGPFKRGTLITPLVQPKLASTSKKVLVRSPMTCEAGDGVCQKCQGLDEKGNPHILGTNVGVRAAQAMAEPLTQFALDAKHGGRTAKGERKKVGGIRGFRQIIESPRQFINKATLATETGTIKKVEKAPQGGHFVFVEGEKHFVSPNLDVVVNRGDAVEAGDALSEGIPKPDEVVKYKGLGAGRKYMVDTLKELYQNQGRDLDQRHFELLARGELDSVRIADDPGDNFLRGDTVSYNQLKSVLNRGTKEVPVKEAIGQTLGRDYFHFSTGLRITPQVAKFLKKEKVNTVHIAPRAPEVEFVMKPATRAPLLNPDWMARLAHRNLKVTLQQAAQFGDKSNIHGTHPVPAYVMGVEFGKGERGRY